MSPSQSKSGKDKRKKDAICSATAESEHPTFPSFPPTFPKIEEINMIEKKIESDNNKVENISDKDVTNNYTWDILGSYFKDQHLRQLVRHQIESYNNFINYQIQKTINMFNPVKIVSDQDYVKELDLYNMEILVNFENFQLQRPQIHENNGASKLMFPQEARLRNYTYASMMTVDMNIQYCVRSGKELEQVQTHFNKIPNIHIGKLPIMLKSSICVLNQYQHINHEASGECQFDAGGYFIINGSEKTVLGQERAAENRIYCFDVSKNNTKWSWLAEIKSVPDFKCISPKQINIMITSKNSGFGHSLYIQIPRMKQPVPLFVVFRALGIISDKDICKIIVLDMENKNYSDILNSLQGSIVDANRIVNQNDAIEFMMNHVMYTPFGMDRESGIKKKREFTMSILNDDLFPHCHNQTQKIYFLGLMTSKLIQCSLNLIESADRDSYINKRIDLTGTLLNNLFRNYFNKLVKDMQKQIVREINNGSWKSTNDYINIINNTNIYKIIKSTTIENGLKRALSTGDFGIKNVNSNKVGVAQVLNRLTYISSLSHLRRINTPIDKSGKLVPPRKLHNSSWGFLCPAETPEGASVGVVKNLSYMTHMTIPTYSAPIYEYIKEDIVPLEDPGLDDIEKNNGIKVLINGAWVGMAISAYSLYEELKKKKLSGIINIYTSIIFDIKSKEIRVCTDAGRLTRPLYIVKNNKLTLTEDIAKQVKNEELSWNDLLTCAKLDDTVIEYLDPEEQGFQMLAMNTSRLTEQESLKIKYQFTHCEIHPSTIFGILASCIPFPDNNQSPRNTYQSAMGKQAMGMYVTNYDTRMDKTAFVLTYPARPLVDTRLMGMVQLDKIPAGSPVIVAIMTHTGYNQEDSLLFNQGAVDRGLFQATIYHTEKDEDKKINGDEEIRCKPDPNKTKGMKYGNYDKINDKGVIDENTLLNNNDVIIAKMVPIKENRNDHTKVIKYEDMSRTYRTVEKSYIDKNYIDRNGDGYKFCKVRIRAFRKPTIGDKFSSRHGQKGTIGNIIAEEDMPFTADGVKPDIIINPHAIPSRMTIGQLKETLLGKVLVQLGLFGDGTAFGNKEMSVENISKELVKLGYESYGNEIMYDGHGGRQLSSSIFIGPVFYQRLKHMVNDKQHSRSIGPMVNLTRQPAEGRSRDGGLRFGEMERDCMCSHGASRFTKGRIYDASDKYQLYVCKRCGSIASYNNAYNIHLCRMCDNRVDFSYIEIPYSCKLLFHELMTMNIAPRIIT